MVENRTDKDSTIPPSLSQAITVKPDIGDQKRKSQEFFGKVTSELAVDKHS